MTKRKPARLNDCICQLLPWDAPYGCPNGPLNVLYYLHLFSLFPLAALTGSVVLLSFPALLIKPYFCSADQLPEKHLEVIVQEVGFQAVNPLNVMRSESEAN
eukprot:scaffold16804_cov15-Tisochrysis_lutea.AAC.1